MLNDTHAVDTVEGTGAQRKRIDGSLDACGTRAMNGQVFTRSVNRFADVASNDVRSKRGDHIRETSGAAARIKHQFAPEPRRLPSGIGEKSPLGQIVAAQSVDLDRAPTLPLKPKISKLARIRARESGNAAANGERSATLRTGQMAFLDISTSLSFHDKIERARRPAHRTFEERKNRRMHWSDFSTGWDKSTRIAQRTH
jgi:hypothetical protein